MKEDCVIMYESIIDRIQEIIKRTEKNSINDAYILAWKIGLTADLVQGLTKIKRRWKKKESSQK